jgi:hypothetical protein
VLFIDLLLSSIYSAAYVLCDPLYSFIGPHLATITTNLFYPSPIFHLRSPPTQPTDCPYQVAAENTHRNNSNTVAHTTNIHRG